MAKCTITILLLSLTILLAASGAASCRHCSRTRAFITSSCSTTRYPKVCVQTLLGHINNNNLNHEELAQTSLRVSLTRAQFARAYLTKLSSRIKRSHPNAEYLAIGRCIDQINDSVAQLKQSLTELQKFSAEGGVDTFMWHMSNVVTWTSAALTDQTDCAEAFAGSSDRHKKSIKVIVNAKVNEVSQVTSNALALVNRFVTRRRFSRGATHRKP